MKKTLVISHVLRMLLVTTLATTLLFQNAMSAHAESSSWLITGSMIIARAAHTATLLPNGKVLVAGGCTASDCRPATALASAELYNPATGVWTVTGSMNSSRVEHTAKLLPNGKVLVAGGHNSEGVLSSAELYDPDTGKWAYTGSMHDARYSFATILLPNSGVLVAGGVGSAGFLSSAELYNSATGIWTTTESMHVARSGAGSLLLPNGKVLVAGGENSDSYQVVAELYDPDKGTWAYTGSMHTTHQSPMVQLSNGLALYAGSPVNSSSELYNPTTGTWSYTGSFSVVRRTGAIVRLLNGKILAAGGSIWGDPSGTSVTAELYDPDTGLWTTIVSMHNPMPGLTATLLHDGTVLVAGGNSAEIYSTGQKYLFLPLLIKTFDQIPTPVITTLSPSSTNVGGTAFILIVNGANFINGSVVNWDENPLSTTFLSSSQLAAIIPAENISLSGTYSITVSNPPPAGGTSNAVNFTVDQ